MPRWTINPLIYIRLYLYLFASFESPRDPTALPKPSLRLFYGFADVLHHVLCHFGIQHRFRTQFRLYLAQSLGFCI